MLEEFGPDLFSVDGPTLSFFGAPYPTRMVVARLSGGSAWVWSPIALTERLASAVETIGPVRFIVSPNKLHHLFLQDWCRRWPNAIVFAPPGLMRKKPNQPFAATLCDEPDPRWAADIDQVLFRGSFAMEEVVFYHRPSRTAIVGDLIQRFRGSTLHGWKRALMYLGGVVGERGGTPRDWRASFLRRGQARSARARVLAWSPNQLLIAHGECAHSGAKEIIARALSWM